MRKSTLLLGVLLLAGAAGVFGYRWLYEPARYGRYQQPAAGSWRGFSEPRAGTVREHRFEPSGRREARGGLGTLRVFELVIDLLNVVVGGIGIWLAVIGVRMQRGNSTTRQLQLPIER